MNLKYMALSVLALFFVSCQSVPTRVGEGSDRQINSSSLLQRLNITENTVVVDARPQFDYSVAHIPKSVPLQWSDFTEPEPSQRGILQGDLFDASRRLARMGIGPQTPVVVVGHGQEGNGEEGRVAWMLAYLGVTSVQFADIDALEARFTNVEETNFPPPVPIWKPEPAAQLDVTRSELLFAMNERAVDKPMAYQGRSPMLYKIIDVRNAADYLGREGFGARNKVPNMDAVNIPWRQFFTEEFRPRHEILQELMGIGILPEQRIIVLDDSGVRSAAVTMALQALGYSNAGNYSGGLTDLLSGPNKNR